MYVLNQPSSLLSPEERGCSFFKSLKLFLLEQQQRSVDPIQTGIISALRVTDPQVYPITKPILGNFDFVSTDDIRSNTLWELAPIIVALNMILQEINRLRMIRFAILSSQVIFVWRNALCGKAAAGITAEERQLLYSTHQALSGKFIYGMPSTLLDNINPKKNLSNGTRFKMHSMCLDPREDLDDLITRISKAKPSDEILLFYPPISVNVEIPDADPTRYSPEDSMQRGSLVVPIFAKSRSRYEPIKSYETLNRIYPIEGVRYRSIGVEPQFAMTFEKSQSLTLPAAIVDLNPWPGMHLTFEKFYVSVTRTKSRKELWLMPMQNGNSFDHLYSLKPDPSMLVWTLWRAGFAVGCRACQGCNGQIACKFF